MCKILSLCTILSVFVDNSSHLSLLVLLHRCSNEVNVLPFLCKAKDTGKNAKKKWASSAFIELVRHFAVTQSKLRACIMGSVPKNWKKKFLLVALYTGCSIKQNVQSTVSEILVNHFMNRRHDACNMNFYCT
jgi:hypothetical protein